MLILNYKGHFLFVLLATFSLFTYSQGKSYRQKLTEGNQLFLEKNYTMALQQFLEAYAIDSSTANINYKIGLCYLNLADGKHKAYYFLEKASHDTHKRYEDFEPSEKEAPLVTIYYLGQACQLDNKFDEAITNYNQYKEEARPNANDTKEIDRRIEMALTGIALTKKPVTVLFKNLGDSINTDYPEYNALVSGDRSLLVFTSRRPGSTGGEKTMDGQFYEDIYCSHKLEDGSWSSALPIGKPINTNENERSAGLSSDGKQLLIYKEINGGDLFISNRENNMWSNPVPLNSTINSSYSENEASFSPDGNILYFSSNRPGGYGGYDIYRSAKLSNGDWGPADNLGPLINTAFDERAPFMSPDGITLYFSSDGKKSMGGFDIFRTVKQPGENNWSKTENVGYPINNADDDTFFVPLDSTQAYISTVRSWGKGDLDIYQLTMDPSKLVKKEIKQNTYNPPENIQQVAFQPQQLQEEREPTYFPPIQFDFEKYTLRAEAIAQLNEMAEYLKTNDYLRMEIAGYTDDKGNDSFNDNLSLKRAQVIVNFFESKGIDNQRLAAVGKGKRSPLALNENPDHSDNPEGRQKNRRAEFRLLDAKIITAGSANQHK